MTPLRYADGTPFAVGSVACACRPVRESESLTRLFVEVSFPGDVDVEAVVDTGGPYLIVPPEVANRQGLVPSGADLRAGIVVRGVSVRGHLHRLPLTFRADQGENVTINATAFVPELWGDEEWTLPLYLGWQGCLERLRFGVDPFTERFYFGS